MRYIIFNHTDGIPGPGGHIFDTEEEANEFITSWREIMKDGQGYYLTSNMERIPVEEVELEIQPFEDEERPTYSQQDLLGALDEFADAADKLSEIWLQFDGDALQGYPFETSFDDMALAIRKWRNKNIMELY